MILHLLAAVYSWTNQRCVYNLFRNVTANLPDSLAAAAGTPISNSATQYQQVSDRPPGRANQALPSAKWTVPLHRPPPQLDHLARLGVQQNLHMLTPTPHGLSSLGLEPVLLIRPNDPRAAAADVS